jgi:hypothetical protein
MKFSRFNKENAHMDLKTLQSKIMSPLHNVLTCFADTVFYSQHT